MARWLVKTSGYITLAIDPWTRLVNFPASKNVYWLNMGIILFFRLSILSGCQRCRARHSVTEFNPLFPTCEGHGSWGASMAIFTVFMTVEGHSLTQIVRELGVSEPYARIWMSRARFIMAMDAEKRQAEIVFGQLVKDDGQETVAFIEADETCVFSWREAGDEQLGTEDTWHWYVYLGFLQRGSTEKFWVKPMALRQSRKEPRIPQLSKREFLVALDEAGFGPTTRCVLFTDSAPVFSSTGHVGIIEHHQVNHSEKEWSRSVEVLVDGKQRPSLCHTRQLIGLGAL